MISGTPIEFEVRTPATQDRLKKQVAWSRSRGYAEIQEAQPRPGVMTIIANGPSAVLAPFSDTPTAALNGSIRLFTDRGLHPTFWAACDPQAMVANFVKTAPVNTSYLLASKCHPRTFKALKNRNVRIWHIDDLDGLPGAVPTATSITLTALSLFRRMGWREFRVFGWDGCYMAGADHAVPQRHKRVMDVDVEVNGRTFKTTSTWALEVQDAVNQLAGADYRVTIEGDGLIKAVVGALLPDHQSGHAG
jgi:hypothetical protein